MKSIAKSLSLLTMILMGYGCNEKISPELQNGNSTTIPPTVTPTEYYFRLVNNSPTVLNYVLHRTGASNQTTNCSVSGTTAFSSDLFSADVQANGFDQRTYDISCFMEAEELALYFNGLNYKIEASMNTCEYIAYTPYGYYDAIPGNSSATFEGITCGEDTSAPNPLDVSAFAVANGLVYGAGSTPIGCNQMVDTSIATVALREVFTIPEDDQVLCKYDHTDNGGSPNSNGQNCDTGRITFEITEAFDSDTEAPYVFNTRAVSKDPHNCGGTVAACVNGPIRQESQLDGSAFGSVIYNSELNTNYEKSYSLPALIGVRSGMYDIVNFRKGLASYNLDYGDYNSINDTNWGNTTYRTSFDPGLIERWANNRDASNSVIFSASAAETVGYTQFGMTATPLAADPFLGFSKVSPLYNFLCLDRAFEIKARIRMVVRDWDRVFPNNTTSMSYISDVFEPILSRRQDLPSDEEEVPGDGGVYMYYNDKDDWDVLIPMRRSAGASPQVYAPGQYDPDGAGPEVAYTLWWDSSIFPMEGPR